jgi:hypothetical protein
MEMRGVYVTGTTEFLESWAIMCALRYRLLCRTHWKLHSLWVGFEVLTAVSMKIAVFWVVAPCSRVEVFQSFRGACWRHHPDYMGGRKYLPDVGGRKRLWNVVKLLPDYTVLQPRRQPSLKNPDIHLPYKFIFSWTIKIIGKFLNYKCKLHFYIMPK